MRTFVNIGDGVMDFKALADALKAIGFQGCISLEQGRNPGDIKAVCALPADNARVSRLRGGAEHYRLPPLCTKRTSCT